MYNQKLVASLKANGRILREFKDTVYIPFGSEYSFLLKNLNTKRALITVYIDGEDMTPGGLVLNPGQEVDLERSIKNGNLREGNRFKFIERTGNIEQHRGVKLEDGLVRIEYQFELYDYKLNQFFINNQKYHSGILRNTSADWISPASTTYSSVSGSASSSMDCGWITASGATTNISAQSAHIGAPANDVGITVPGSKSTQSFTTTTMGVMESEKHTIVLKLLGETPDNKPVLQPVNVKMKPKCVTCGKINKGVAKFCNECGTALEIFA
jgi:hypothetical protein